MEVKLGPKGSPKPKLLIIDDQPVDIEIPFILANELGFDVTLAFDGQEGLAKLAEEHFGLVILDWNMPNGPGWQFLFELETRHRRSPQLEPINIILYSGEDLESLNFNFSPTYTIVDIWRKPIGVLQILKHLKRISREVRL